MPTCDTSTPLDQATYTGLDVDVPHRKRSDQQGASGQSADKVQRSSREYLRRLLAALFQHRLVERKRESQTCTNGFTFKEVLVGLGIVCKKLQRT